MILPRELEAQAARMVLLMILVPPQLPPLMGGPEEEKRTSTRYCLPSILNEGD